jgi:hypothetical protein
MRLGSCLVLSALLVFATRAQPCVGLNPFLPRIEAQMRGIMLQSLTNSAAAVNNKCGYEWARYKTCCNYDNLAKYILQDRLRTDQIVVSINNNLNRLKDEYIRFKKIMESASKVEAIMKNPNLRGLVELIKFFNSPDSADITNWMTQFGGVAIDQQNSNACLDNLKKVRSGSVCSVCSGRSAVWFEGHKAKFNSDYCKPFLKYCAPSIKFLGNYGERATIFFGKLHSFDIGGLKVGGKGISIANLARPLDLFMESLKKLHTFRMAIDFTRNPNDLRSNNDLCDSIVTLVNEPFLVILNKMCLLARIYLSGWNDLADTIGKNHHQTISNWSHRSRSLQSSELTAFKSDVKVVDVHAKIDSSYSSTFGAIGTNGNENSIKLAALPLNLTAAFP